MKVGFIGLGNVFPLHLNAVRSLPDVDIVGCHDTEHQPLIAAQERGLPTYRELPKLFGRKPDVIHVLVPPQHHVRVATFALEQGANCFLEKPAALSVQGIEELISASSLACKKIAVNHNQLFNPGFLRAVKMIRDRRIGALEHVHVHYELSLSFGADHFALKDPANMIWELAPHPLSLIYDLLGPAQSVRAQLLGSNDSQTSWRKWQAILACDRGSASCYVSSNATHEDSHMTISGEDGSIYVDLLRGTACALTKHFEIPFADALYASVRQSMSLLCQSASSAFFAMSSLFTEHQLKDPYTRSLSTSISNFYTSLRNGGNPLCDMKHAEAIVQACEMTVQALKKTENSA